MQETNKLDETEMKPSQKNNFVKPVHIPALQRKDSIRKKHMKILEKAHLSLSFKEYIFIKLCVCLSFFSSHLFLPFFVYIV